MAAASGVPSFRPLRHPIRPGDRAAYEERQGYAADDPENEEHNVRGGVEWRAGQDGFEHHAGHEPDSTQAVLEQKSRTGGNGFMVSSCGSLQIRSRRQHVDGIRRGPSAAERRTRTGV